MIIDFNETEFLKTTDFLGGKGNFFIRSVKDDLNNIMCDVLEAGASIGYHKHAVDSEIIFILKGHGEVKYDNEVKPIKAGQCHYCPKGHCHCLINSSDEELVFFAVVCSQ